MALDKNKLKSELLNWLNADNSSIAISAENFGTAFENYAKDALDFTGDKLLTYNKAGLETNIKTLTNNETAETASVKFETAIIAFWTGATFELTIPPATTILPEISAIVTTNIVVGTLSAPLAIIFNDTASSNTKESKAEDIADALHTATITLLITCTGTHPSSSAPVPIIGPIV